MLFALLSVALAQTPVTELTVSYRPQHIAYARGELTLDGVPITGSRTDKRLYLEAILPTCAAEIEERRARRARAGRILGLGGLAVVVGASAMAPVLSPAVLLGAVIAGGGAAAGGGTLALSGASLQRSIQAYNACAGP